MANKIARGTTGSLVEFTDTHNDFVGPPIVHWNLTGTFAGVPYSYSNSSPGGFTVDDSLNVFVPLGQPVGIVYNLDYWNERVYTGVAPYPWTIRIRNASFTVVCMTVEVSISKLSSAPVPSSSPVQYEHKYTVDVEAQGGIAPYAYVWATSTGAISASGDSGTLTVINSYTNYENVTGTVTCNVTSSDIPPCYASDSASIENGNPTIEGWWPCAKTGDSKEDCGCDKPGSAPTCKADDCPQPTGNFTASSFGSDPAEYKNYAGGSAPSLAWGIAKH